MKKKELAIKIENLSKTFFIAEDRKYSLKSLVAAWFRQGKTRRFKAVDNISMSFDHGDFIGIIGRNGSGKSTLLKIIAGIYDPDKGSILEVKGSIVPFIELGVGFNPDLTGRENIYLNGTILGMTTKFLTEKFAEIVSFAELEEFIDTAVKHFSSGMMVRLAFSIAIQANADIYIFDEILAVGDEVFQQKSRKIIDKFIEAGKTIIFVTHDVNAVKKYCTKTLWLDHGKAMYYGDTETAVEMYSQSNREAISNS